ncbi:hypothetical protein C8J57DRAFT_1547271 [Mycena rebaudengoi]|nr:hypothetical protein C8J57DRAFT_1547271 [Mycena rebaudengoi]
MGFAAKGESPASEAAAVAAIQAILDTVHPGNTLTLTWNDKICSRIVCRVRERRSLIGVTALRAVEKLFQGDVYMNQPVAIRSYTAYAAGLDGPGFWKVPTPENCTTDPEAPGYIRAKGYLESPLIIARVAPFLKNEEFGIPQAHTDGKYNFDGIMPTGLFSLAAAGVERALNLYTATGILPTALPKFSKTTAGTAVAGYSKNIRAFTASRWTSLLKAGGGLPSVDTVVPVSSTLQDGLRDVMYIPSSP